MTKEGARDVKNWEGVVGKELLGKKNQYQNQIQILINSYRWCPACKLYTESIELYSNYIIQN